MTRCRFGNFWLKLQQNNLSYATAKSQAIEAVENRIADWHDDLSSSQDPVIDSSDVTQLGNTTVYVLKGHVDVVINAGFPSSKAGRIFFSVKLDAETGKVLSIKQEDEK